VCGRPAHEANLDDSWLDDDAIDAPAAPMPEAKAADARSRGRLVPLLLAAAAIAGVYGITRLFEPEPSEPVVLSGAVTSVPQGTTTAPQTRAPASTIAAPPAPKPAATTTSTAPTTTVTSTTQPAASAMVTPVRVSATATRPAVPELRCGGSNSFEPALLVDGDVHTGWGAGTGDGAGKSLTVAFGTEMHLTRIGLTPGYLRVAPRWDHDCAPVQAFEYNRFVAAVRWRFDDGSSVRQDFEREPTLQMIDVDVTTRTVRITILETEPTVDDDTILSEAVFLGYAE
jgi:hypothetical protein